MIFGKILISHFLGRFQVGEVEAIDHELLDYLAVAMGGEAGTHIVEGVVNVEDQCCDAIR